MESDGVNKIKKEREKQQIEHGYFLAHDQEHDDRELLVAAILTLHEHVPLSQNQVLPVVVEQYPAWCESIAIKHQDSYRRALETAGALIAAELDRLQYKYSSNSSSESKDNESEDDS